MQTLMSKSAYFETQIKYKAFVVRRLKTEDLLKNVNFVHDEML